VGQRFKIENPLLLTFLQSYSLWAIHQKYKSGLFESLLQIPERAVVGHGPFLLKGRDGTPCDLCLSCQFILGPAKPSPGGPTLLWIYH
jgi:hypothetical protein